ncbi:MAG: hypothetical protein WCS77_02890 [Elusimicrobiaceae bacterium]
MKIAKLLAVVFTVCACAATVSAGTWSKALYGNKPKTYDSASLKKMHETRQAQISILQAIPSDKDIAIAPAIQDAVALLQDELKQIENAFKRNAKEEKFTIPSLEQATLFHEKIDQCDERIKTGKLLITQKAKEYAKETDTAKAEKLLMEINSLSAILVSIENEKTDWESRL